MLVLVSFVCETSISFAQNSGDWVQLNPPGTFLENAMAFDSLRDELIVVSDLGDTMAWDGTAWTQVGYGTGPISVESAMVFDKSRGEIVLFGGRTKSNPSGAFDTYSNQTWIWNGTGWTQKFPAVSPPAAAGVGMAFDESRGVTVLFTGSPASQIGTWTWDGATWQHETPTLSPSERYDFSIAYDQGMGKAILFGGIASTDGRTYQFSDETWTWDGSSWKKELVTSAPFPRAGAAIINCGSPAYTILFGGKGSGGLLDDTWSLEGDTWKQMFPMHSPSARTDSHSACDSETMQPLLFRGATSFTSLQDFWTWKSVAPSGTIYVSTNLSQTLFTVSDGNGHTYTGGGPSCATTAGCIVTSAAPPGTYSINFSQAPGYITPAMTSQILLPGGNIKFVGVYALPSLLVSPTSLAFNVEEGSGGRSKPQSILVDSDGPPLSFALSISAGIRITPWLSASSMSGVTPANIEVTAHPHLRPGTYLGDIVFNSSNSANGPIDVPVTLEIRRQSIALLFPVHTDPSCGPSKICSPSTAPITAVFDHEMDKPYEQTCPQKGRTVPRYWGSIEDFRGEQANQKASTTGFGKCSTLFGYSNGQTFLNDLNYYHGHVDSKILWYDSHPGYDYGFAFGTGVYASTSGCVSYSLPAAVAGASQYHVLTIVPADKQPPEGCAAFIKHASGYRIAYMHLASFEQDGVILRSMSKDGVLSQIVPCSASQGCAQPNTWVSADTLIGYSGNFAATLEHPQGTWRGVPEHLHFEVDLSKAGELVPVDPYGWHSKDTTLADPYTTIHPSISNITLWKDYTP